MSSHTLSVLVQNVPGVLARVSGLVSRRGFNIESLAVGPTESPEISRITLSVDVDDLVLEQMTKQLNKLIEVLKIVELETSAVHRELILIKVGADIDHRGRVLEILQLFQGAKAVDIQPSITVALSEDCRLQGRIDVVTRTNSYQVRTGDYSNDVISVYLILRRYWGDRPKDPMEKMLADMAERGEELCINHLIPKVLKPISSVIASRS